MAGVRDLSGEPYKSHREHHAAKARLEAAAPDLLKGAVGRDIRITRYGRTRFWAVWIGEDLLAVVCYKKGAYAIRDAFLSLKISNAGDAKSHGS